MEAARERDYLVIEGDATDDDVLRTAGIDRAKNLVAALTGDAANVLVTITARTMNPDLHIVARGSEKESEIVLVRAGANRVVIPYEIGGKRMATQTLNPSFMDFLDMYMRVGGHILSMEEVIITPGSKLDNAALKDVSFRNRTDGAVIMAVKRESDDITLHPAGDYVLHSGDHLLILCDKQQLKRIYDEFDIKPPK
ncbi:potassium channel protein, partial [bacterium]|nr:potassium channel protein [bacterium]